MEEIKVLRFRRVGLGVRCSKLVCSSSPVIEDSGVYECIFAENQAGIAHAKKSTSLSEVRLIKKVIGPT